MLPYSYFLKVMLCSAVLFAYYLIALRNKTYHQYNRFYLLSITVLSWLLPLLHFTISQVEQPIAQTIVYVNAVSNGVDELSETMPHTTNQLNIDNYISIVYIAIALLLIAISVASLYKIFKITTRYKKYKQTNCTIFFTNEPNTPFSFFSKIFWNINIDIESPVGTQILQHELTHIQQKHSYDKLLMQLNIIVGWFNPMFWFIKKELEMIHEFIADKKSVPQSSTQQFAAMLLTTAFPQQQLALTNPFFFSPIKRRLIMLSKIKTSKFSYLQRLIALPILALTIALVAFKVTKNAETASLKLEKKYVVVIDAGHGGKDFGATAKDETLEKDIALKLANYCHQVNTNNNIEIVLTRNTDLFQSVKDKADFSNNSKANVFVSLHCNSSNSQNSAKKNGTEIYVVSQEKDNGFRDVSIMLAQQVNNSLSKNFVTNNITSRAVGVWVLQATQCPAILIEAGYLDNEKDLQYLKNEEQLKLMATQIVNGVTNYLYSEEQKVKQSKTTIANLDTAQIMDVNGNIVAIEQQQKASDEEVNEFKNFVEAHKTASEKFSEKYNFSNVSDAEEQRIYAIYNKMSGGQKAMFDVHFLVLSPLKKEVPTQEQIIKWTHNKAYGVWIDDGGRIQNSTLSKYKATDFSNYNVSKLYGAAIGKDGHTVQVDLMTNKYYENYVAKRKAKPYVLAWGSGKYSVAAH